LITDPTAVFFVLAAIVALALALERRWHVFRSFGAAFVGILLGMLLSNTGVLPGRSPAYDFLVGPAVSAGIVLILLSVDVRTIVKAGPRMLAAFSIGAVGSSVGAAVAALALAGQVGPETWKLAGQYAATYTGGGANFAAVGAALGTSGDLFAAGVAADVIVTAIWMAICLTAPVVLARARGGDPDAVIERPDVGEAGGRLYTTVGTVDILDIAVLAAIVLGTLGVSAAMGRVFEGVPSVLWLTTVALVLAQIPRVARVRGAGVIGNWLVLLFLASNGAKSVVANIVAVGPPVMWFALVTVGVHGVIIFGVGLLVRLDPRTLAVASQANVGGSASAMALASARGWTADLLPGIAVGLAGNAVGNYIGIGVAVVVRGWLGA
jgi:uncharacterized membrane protein